MRTPILATLVAAIALPSMAAAPAMAQTPR